MVIIFIIAVIIFFLLFIAGNFFYAISIKPGVFARMTRRGQPITDSSAEPVHDEIEEWWKSLALEVVKMTSYDGCLLCGYYAKNINYSGKLAVLIHGYSGRASEMAVYAKIYYDMGFDIFAPDNRGHGESGGKAIGMGWLDRLDYLRWLKILNARNDNSKSMEILIHGHSMGGAVASILAGEELPLNVKGIISDCAYDSVKNILKWQLKHMFKMPAFPMLQVTSVICKVRAGYFFGEGDVTARVAKCKIPVMFIHGNQDTFVPFSMVDNLYNSVDPSLRELWIVDGAKHIGSIRTDAEGYVSRIKSFVDRVFTDAAYFQS